METMEKALAAAIERIAPARGRWNGWNTLSRPELTDFKMKTALRKVFIGTLKKKLGLSPILASIKIFNGRYNLNMRLFLCGDVMTARGIDQILPHPGDPTLYEAYMKSASGYVELAEEHSGPIEKPVTFSYIWGEAIDELERMAPDLRIINLETAVTVSGDHPQGKEVLYRMNPANIPCITAAGIDCYCLANNHMLDWGDEGLLETLATLRKAKLRYAGAGRNIREAEAPAIIETAKGRVIVYAVGSTTSGIPLSWAASEKGPGVNLLADYSDGEVRRITEKIASLKKKGDFAVASIHWGGNWGYHIPDEEREFAHKLIEGGTAPGVKGGGIDLIHGHSSHHVKGIEVYKGKLILYGAGDFINDYEGIHLWGHKQFRGDLSLMYFADVDPSTGRLTALTMVPTQLRRMSVKRASRRDALWLRDVLSREGKTLGTDARLNEDNTLSLAWPP